MHHSPGQPYAPPPPPPPPPGPPAPDPEDEIARKAATAASVALLAFATLTALALVAWFSHADDPWTWRSGLALVSAMLGVTMSALIWRAPTRINVIVGIAVMAASLLRIGVPSEWTWVSFTLLSMTVLLVVPLVHAAIVLR